jgi:hypothetical protein
VAQVVEKDEKSDAGIRRTLAEYCVLADDGAFARWSELFASDAVLLGNGAVLAEGRDAILRWITDARPSRAGGKHLTVNSIINVAAGTAEVSSDFLFLASADEGPVLAAAGRYADKLVCEDDRWRFARRDIQIPQGWIRAAAFAGQTR